MGSPLRAFKNGVVERMTASHLAGPVLTDALHVYTQARSLGWSATFGYWSAPGDTPETFARIYAEAVDFIGGKSLDCYLSIKVTGFKFDFGLMMALLDQAEEKGVRVHCDAMAPDSAAPTFALLERVLQVHRNVGCTLPARWERSLDDTARVIEWGIPVRVVKGQWADPLKPRLHAAVQYLEVIRRLSEGAFHVAVATHDRRVAREALRQLRSTGTSCEMEQLSSLPQNCAPLAESLHVPLRLYIPYGFPSLPYSIWQARTRPQIVGWVLRDIFSAEHRKLPSAVAHR